MSALYFIPIRKGSKEIPGKNMRILGDKPLLAWVLNAIIASNTADETWVATDDERAVDYINSTYPQVKIFHRSETSASDKANVTEVIMEFISSTNPDSDTKFILAQATSPFTKPEDFRDLCNKMEDASFDSFISCRRIKRFIWHEDGYPVSYELDSKPLRQNYPGILIESGAFYASTVGQIKQSHKIISGKIGIIETSDNQYIDIDTEADWLIAEAIINN
ncbi:MAG: acylneuraminate cytidylyltransferase family protein [Paramuribaculum sp.]|nr:acylneuraminate cytidylyltransferase family protein [Paramuribaculum sp.]